MGQKKKKGIADSREPKPIAFLISVFIHFLFSSINRCLIHWGQPSPESLAPSTAVLKKVKTFSCWLSKVQHEQKNATGDADSPRTRCKIKKGCKVIPDGFQHSFLQHRSD